MHIRILAGVLVALAFLPTVASGSPDTFRRGFGNLVQGPLDVALAPVTAGIVTARNLPETGESALERSAYPVLGYLSGALLGLGIGAMRAATGGIELVAGLALFAFPNTDLPEDFNVFADGEALVEAKNPLAENPSWLKWVLPVTPFTADAKFGVISPIQLYRKRYDSN